MSNARICVRRHVARPLKRKRTGTQILSYHVCATSHSSDSSPSFDIANAPCSTRANDSNWKYAGRDLTNHFNRPTLWRSDHPIAATIVYVTVYRFLPLVHHDSANFHKVKSVRSVCACVYMYVCMCVSIVRENSKGKLQNARPA